MVEGRSIRRRIARWIVVLSVLAATAVLVAAQPTVHDIPFSITFLDRGLPALAADSALPFYVYSNNRRIELTGPTETIPDADGTQWQFVAEDGRIARIRIGEGPDGSVRVVFTVESKGEFEKLGVRLRVGEPEGFYGLMERVVQGSQGLSWKPGVAEGLNLRGQTVDLYTLPTVSIYAPFFVSSAGYGVFVESDWPGTYRFGVDEDYRTTPTQITIEQEGPELSFLLLPGPTPANVVERYARLTGLPLLPPEFILGPGRWRDIVWDLPTFFDGTPDEGPFNSMIVEDVLMMEALGIPCRWIVVDRPWASGTFGYGDMTFDDVRLPKLESMIAWLDSRGIETLLWLGPWVMDGQRDEAIARGFHVPLTIPYLPNAALIDFTDPEARTWWIAEVLPLFESGISGFKLDRGEEKPPDGQLFRGAYADGTPYREGHNAYPLWFAEVAREAAVAAGAEDFVSFYRAGWVGSSQHTVAWGGDTDPSLWGLRSAVIAVQRAAFLNTPVWGSDTGGYNTRPPREALARWLAFSAFCPIMEVGPMANLAPWSWLPDESTQEVSEAGYTFDTVYDEELLAIWATYGRLHADLSEAIHALAREASERGTPIVRPLVLAYPDDARFVDAFELYLLGPDLLVRPVWEEGATRVDVLLPEGGWLDAWTGERHEGPTTVTVDVPLHVIPVFVREAGSVALDDLAARWENARTDVRQRPDLAKLAEKAFE